MSSLRTVDKIPLEDILEMSSGYVLDFSDPTYTSFFVESVGVDINDERFLKYGTSKAKKMRAFWEVENDQKVGKVLFDLLELWEVKHLNPSNEESARLKQCKAITAKLLRDHPTPIEKTESQFLATDFAEVSIALVPIEESLIPILESRYSEAVKCHGTGSSLAAVILCGSILEGLLLGVALKDPRAFNAASSSPKDKNGKVKPFQEWSLAQFIDVAYSLKLVRLDVKKFSHALRDFRNYIHPYQQMASSFNPDHHTAAICMQVLRAAIASLAK